ncbi:hypothetical protein [Acetobacter fabarum]|uniref:hypothetical protein n=1 Tax=Acetobacter fabarum TaxID=483199 RepID=UPI0033A57953
MLVLAVCSYRFFSRKQKITAKMTLFTESSIIQTASAGTAEAAKLTLIAQPNVIRANRRNATLWFLGRRLRVNPSLFRTKARLQAQSIQAATIMLSVRPKTVSVMAAPDGQKA